MRALVYKSIRNIQVEDVEIPHMGDFDVLIKVKYCGVCGTDIHIYKGDGGAFEVNPPLIMGHEFSGIVKKVGKKVKKITLGDMVTVDPNNACGECYFCKNVMEQFCEHVIGIGTTTNGGFAQYIVVCEKQVFRFREGVDMITAAMAEPLSCCLHGVDLCNITVGDEVLVIGGGPIGLIILQLVKMAGASKVILTEPIEEKRKLAKRLGADVVIDPLEEDVPSILRSVTKNINVVIECVGNVHTIDNAIQWAGNRATVMMYGLTGPKAELSLKPEIIFKKELKLTSSFINPYTFERTITIIESGKINLVDMITDIVELENAVNVFENEIYRSRGKIMIKMYD